MASVTADHAVLGAVYEIAASEKPALDRAEGLGDRYHHKNATVILNGGEVAVSIYFSERTDRALKPYTWNKASVVAKAREHALPAPYIVSLETVEASDDPNRARHDSNMRTLGAPGPLDVAQV